MQPRDMSASLHPVIKALDTIASNASNASNAPLVGYQYGENNHLEYNSVGISLATLQEKIMQFSFQLVRTTSDTGFLTVAKETRDILTIIMNGIKTFDKGSNDYNKCIDMGVIMFKLMAQTRDIICGKGEYGLFYVMLLEWSKIDFRFFEYVIETLVYDVGGAEDVVDAGDEGDGNGMCDTKSKQHPLGSWKDMKYFLTYMKGQLIDGLVENEEEKENNSKLFSRFVDKVVCLINEQLRIDAQELQNNGSRFSLVARWIPREKSKKFGWLYYYLAMSYSQHQIPHDTTHPSYERAVNRAFMVYRKIISALNKKLDTTQVKQCDGKWAEINFDNVTSITMHKQANSFLNLKKNGKTTRCENNEDRDDCKNNYEEYLRNVVGGKSKIKGKRVSIIDFVKSAIECIKNSLPNESPVVTALNEQWKSNSAQNGNLGNFIAMADVSGSMMEDNSNPLHSAIGLSIRVAEKSILGQRVMTFSERPTWVQLGVQDSDTFVKQVSKLRTSSWGMTTNFYLALDLIREGIEDNKLPREVAENLVLVVFSDMQMSNASESMCDLSARETLFENMKQMFAKMGERLYGEPCKAPHIVFWNLRKTTGFPSLSTDQNVSMMSGFSPALLNVFCEKGVAGLQQYTPWTTLVNSLNNDRYVGFERVFKQVVGF